MRYERDQAILIASEIPGQTWNSELAWLYDNLRGSRRHVEIGTYAGRSLFVVAQAMESGELFSVDDRRADHRGIPVEMLEEFTNAVIEQCPEEVLVTKLVARSFEAAPTIEQMVDSVFIDADHSFESVVIDIETWLPKIQSGGIICGHDYWPNHWGVMEAVNRTVPGFSVVPETRIWWKRIE